MVGEVVAVVARVNGPAPGAVTDHVTGEAKHPTRLQSEVIAHLAKGGDAMEERRPRN